MYNSIVIYCKRLIALLLFLIAIPQFVFAQSYTVNGTAVDNGNGIVKLTSQGVPGGQTASAWNTTQIDLTQPYDMSFDMFFGCDNGPDGGDGMTFTMHNDVRGLNTVGAGFGFLGIGGNPAETIQPALSIEFDTYNSSLGSNESPPAEDDDHIAIDLNGDVNTGQSFIGVGGLPVTFQPVVNGRDLESCGENANNFYSIRIVWDPVTKTLQLYEEGVLTMTYTNDIVTNVFGGNSMVYWGFTGATGSASNEQWIAPSGSIIPWECSAATSCCVPFTPTATSPSTICNGPITLSVADSYASYSWSDGSTNSTLQVSTAGTYTLNVLQNQGGNLCPGTVDFIISPTGATAALSGGGTLCNNTLTTPLSVDLTGTAPWSLTYAIDGIPQTPVTGITASPYVFQGSGSHVYTLVSVADNSGCGTSTSGSATVDLFPGIPVGHDDVFTAPGTANLSVDDDGGTYEWYDAPTGGTLVFTGDAYTTPVLTGTTTYYVENTSIINTVTKSVAYLDNTQYGAGGNNTQTAPGLSRFDLWMDFVPTTDFTLTSIQADVFITASPQAGGSNVTVYITDNGGPATTFPIPVSGLALGTQSVLVAMNYPVVAGHTYRISYEGAGSVQGIMYWDFIGARGTWGPNPPATITKDPELSITVPNQGWYPGMFDWQVSVPTAASSCGRTPVTAYTCPVAVLSGDAEICNDGSTTPLSVNLTGRAPWTFTYAIDGVAQPAITGITSSPYVFQSSTGAHNYTLVSVSNGDCNGTVSGTATVTFTAGAPIGHDDVFTAPGTANLSVDDDGGTYEWYDAPTGGTLVFTGDAYTTPVLTGTTTYYVENTSIINTVTKSVAYLDNTQYGAGGNNTQTAPGLSRFDLWMDFVPTTDFTLSSIKADVFITASPQAGGSNVTVYITDNGGPATTFPIPVSGLALGTQSVLVAMNYPVVAGHTYRISYEGAGSVQGIMYWDFIGARGTWGPNPPATITKDPELSITVPNQGWYPGMFDWQISVVSSTPACGRTPVTAYVCPTASLSGDAVICNDGVTTTPLSVELTGDSPWTFVYAIDGVDQTALTNITTTPYIITSLTGAHSYTLSSVSNSTSAGCVAGTSGTATVTVKPDAPVGNDVSFMSPSVVSLNVENTGGTYNWYELPSGGVKVGTGETFTTPALSVATTYYVEQVVGLDTSCTRTAISATPIVPVEDLFIPNLITPNDDGKNDVFEIKGLPDESKVVVYNSWGNPIYRADHYENNWSAPNISSGVYYYELELKNGEKFKGWLQIVR